MMADCRDCHWAATGPQPAPWDWMCHAPPVVALLVAGNEATPCRYAREFANVCGERGAHFQPRIGAVNGCLQPDGANSGQDLSPQESQS